MPTDAKGIGYTPVALIDPTTGLPASTGGGGGGGGATGSVTAAGTNGTAAQAVQGITGGVPQPVSGTFFQATQPVSATQLDTSNAALGAPSDAATASGANSTMIGALRAIRDRLLGTLAVQLGTGSAIVGRVGIDQTTQGVTNAVAVVSAPIGSTPNGYQQITTVNAGQTLTPPNAGSLVATVVPDGAGVRMRKDGTAPTATVGMPIPVGAYVKLYGAEIAAAQFTQVAAGAILNVEYGK